MDLKFTIKNGSKPSTQARQHVCGVLAALLANGLRADDDLGIDVYNLIVRDVTAEPDLRRLMNAIRRLQADFARRAQK